MTTSSAYALTEFQITGLYGRADYKLPIKDNRLVLVGENGIGKSTVVTILFYVLTGQWEKLRRFDFASTSVVLNGAPIEITAEQIESYHDLRRPRRHPSARLSMAMRQQITDFVRGRLRAHPQATDPRNVAEEVAIRWRLPLEMAFDAVIELDHVPPSSHPLAELAHTIRSRFPPYVLFLPTYRRIERELTAILPHLGADIEGSSRAQQIRGQSHLELVEFGMEDVENLIRTTMAQLKDDLRAALDKLTQEYLREVLSRSYDSVDAEALEDLSETSLDSVLGRIDESILPSSEKAKLRETLQGITERRSSLNQGDRVVAHFLVKILRLHRAQAEREQRVRSYISICNEYLIGKRIRFDNSQFNLTIDLTQRTSTADHAEDHREIKFGQLSSGEKQIASLFAHLLLSEHRDHFVIIDEPELSLSVPWQSRFLPDILHSGRSSGFVAVTHSPFIYENELESSTHALGEFVTSSSTTPTSTP